MEEDRTPDLGIANAALSQLSYHPTEEAGFYPATANRNNPTSRAVSGPGGAHFRTPAGAPAATNPNSFAPAPPDRLLRIRSAR